VTEAIRSLTNDKAAGKDGVPTEILKANISSMVDMLQELFVEIWANEDLPVDWKTGLNVEVPKKGDLSVYNS
jgi:hypothetical protein